MNNSQTPLNIVAEKFIQYRGNRTKVKYPDYLWKEAFELCRSNTIEKVADALGINSVYLDRKFQSFGNPIRFAQVKIDSLSKSENTVLEFIASNGSPMKLSFTGGLVQLTELIQALTGIKP